MRIFSTGWSVDKDGPGQRFVIYLKGCNMRCRWCASPESISSSIQTLFYPQRSEADPAYACPHGAVTARRLDRDKCAVCRDRECVRKWRNRCFEIAGEDIAPADLARSIMRSREFFHSDGGVTFGGGEPSLQADEVLQTLDFLRDSKIHTAVESNASTGEFRKFINRLDLLICDLKGVSPQRHEEWTGIANHIILDNLRYAADHQSDLRIRVPLIPGFNVSSDGENSGDDEWNRIVDFLADLRSRREILEVELLRMHHMGQPKYAALGWDYPMEDTPPPSPETAAALAEILQENDINVRHT